MSTGALPSTSPLWLAMYCYNKFRNEPVLFGQERLGVNLSPFITLKFETLYSGAEKEKEHLTRVSTPSFERERTDPRIRNKVMSFMRSTGLNEIPQILNVLKGDMSIVGPRPLYKEFFEKAGVLFPEIMREWRKTALTIKPGLVGVSPLTTRRLPAEEFDKIALEDIQYFEEATFWKDLIIISQAIVSVARGK